MLALPTSEACSENLKCEGTFPNCKDILKLIVFILSLCHLPTQGPFTDSPAPHPSWAFLLLCLEKHSLWPAQIQTWITESLLCFHYKHTGFRLQPFPHAELHWSPMCWEPSGRNPTITEQCTIQNWPECSFSLNFLGMLWGPILQSFNMQNSPGAGRFGNYSRLRSTASRIEHQEEPLARMDLKSPILELTAFLCLCGLLLKWISKDIILSTVGFIPRAEFSFVPPRWIVVK